MDLEKQRRSENIRRGRHPPWVWETPIGPPAYQRYIEPPYALPPPFTNMLDLYMGYANNPPSPEMDALKESMSVPNILRDMGVRRRLRAQLRSTR